MIYSVAVKRHFIARHYLIGGDWGSENIEHSHHYGVEVILEGTQLNEHGFLVDIKEIEARIDEIVAKVRDTTLNDLPEFSCVNPSIECLAGVMCGLLSEKINRGISALGIRIFEDDTAWAACRQEIA